MTTTIALENVDRVLSGERLELRLGEARSLRFPISDRSSRGPTALNLAGASATIRIYDDEHNLIVDAAASVDSEDKEVTYDLPGDAIAATGRYQLELRVTLASGALLRFPHGYLVQVRVIELYPTGEPPDGVPAVAPGVATQADLAAQTIAVHAALFSEIEVSLSQEEHDDYAPTSFADATHIVATCTGSGDSTITGWDASVITGTAKREKVVANSLASTRSLLLPHLSESSEEGNRMQVPGAATKTLAPGESIRMFLSTAEGRWVLIGEA